MGIIKRFRQWLGKIITGVDEEIVTIIGEPIPEPEPVWKIRERVTKEARALWREEAVPLWKRRMMDAVEKGREEEGWTDDEIMERYGGEFV